MIVPYRLYNLFNRANLLPLVEADDTELMLYHKGLELLDLFRESLRPLLYLLQKLVARVRFLDYLPHVIRVKAPLRDTKEDYSSHCIDDDRIRSFRNTVFTQGL